MTLVYLWVYTLVLVFIWILFLVAKIHSYKFKNFSNHIEKTTKFLLFFLISMSIIGYVLILFFSSDINSWSEVKKTNFNEVNY